MTKTLYRPGEIVNEDSRVMLPSPALIVSAEQADEARKKEADAFKAQWEIEKTDMIARARDEAEGIVAAAKEQAENEKMKAAADLEALKKNAQQEADNTIALAKQQSETILSDAQTQAEQKRQEIQDASEKAGHEAGFAEGKAEVDRLIERTQVILERAQTKRQEIMDEAEQQIVDLVLLIARKVVKNISETQSGVVTANIVQALRKVRARGTVIIRVNTADLKLTTEHVKDFLKSFENVESIQVHEDSTVDPGGCIIETDFGEVDARISSQLSELETKILQASPIRGSEEHNNEEYELRGK
jgi:flagellar assembly protein FliH